MTKYLKLLTERLGETYFKITEFGVLPPKSENLNIPEHFSTNIRCDDPEYVYIYPSLQISAHKIKQDTKLTKIIYSFLPLIQEINSRIILCTSYFNLTKWMKKQILSSQSDWNILTSSPESNSFFNCKGFIARIPHIYKYNLHSFIKKSNTCADNVDAFEFFMENQTFHAKGNLLLF